MYIFDRPGYKDTGVILRRGTQFREHHLTDTGRLYLPCKA